MITDQPTLSNTPAPDADEVVTSVMELFRINGRNAYHGEAVSQEEHALQAAWLAEQSGAPAARIASALLHDVGHLLHNLGEDCANEGIDDRHEMLGYQWLSQTFGPEVAVPVKLHVDAKRYLCAVDPSYQAGLSPASQQSLILQGGPMSPEEQRDFEADFHSDAAVHLRRWDDFAKIPNLAVPPLEHYRNILLTAARMR